MLVAATIAETMCSCRRHRSTGEVEADIFRLWNFLYLIATVGGMTCERARERDLYMCTETEVEEKTAVAN